MTHKLTTFLFSLLIGFSSFAQVYDPVKWSYDYALDGDEHAILKFTAMIEPGWHVYATKLEGEGPILVDTQSSSDLAVAGMGDTLTGACAALLGQGLTAPVAGALGLYLSGRAAQRAGLGAGLTPSDVVERIPEVLTEPGPVASDLDLPFVIFDADPAR